MSGSTHNSALHRFALFTALMTLILITIGGVVTSKGAGMSVPDWPTTYGYNMFLFPISQWTGGIAYEHSHRLVASTVGFLVLILAAWLKQKEFRPWVRRLGYLAVFAVILQGVLGGLRVTTFKSELGIFHASFAQIFFVLVCVIALVTSKVWHRLAESSGSFDPLLGRAALLVTLGLLIQLTLGATMRHQHAGLAVPDFPLAYGHVWPATDATALDKYNARRSDIMDYPPVTAAQIHLHMLHRYFAFALVAGVAWCFWILRREQPLLRNLARGWLILICMQAGLGIWTVLSNKAADIATAHVAVGALSLLTGSILAVVLYRLKHLARRAQPVHAYVDAPNQLAPRAV